MCRRLALLFILMAGAFSSGCNPQPEKHCVTLARVCVGSSVNPKFGYIDTDGDFYIQPIYDYLGEFENGYAIAKREGKYCHLSLDGESVYQPEYEDVENFHDGLAAVKKNGKWGFISANGKTAIAIEYEEVVDFADGRAFVKREGKWWLINRYSRQIGNNEYENCRAFKDKTALVKQAGKWYFIKRSGKRIFERGFEGAQPFSEGLAAVKEGGKWGYIDESSAFVIPPQFVGAQSFSEGLAGVSQLVETEYSVSISKQAPPRQKTEFFPIFATLWGYIDRSGRFIIAPSNRFVRPFSEGLAAVISIYLSEDEELEISEHDEYIECDYDLLLNGPWEELFGEDNAYHYELVEGMLTREDGRYILHLEEADDWDMDLRRNRSIIDIKGESVLHDDRPLSKHITQLYCTHFSDRLIWDPYTLFTYEDTVLKLLQKNGIRDAKIGMIQNLFHNDLYLYRVSTQNESLSGIFSPESGLLTLPRFKRLVYLGEGVFMSWRDGHIFVDSSGEVVHVFEKDLRFCEKPRFKRYCRP